MARGLYINNNIVKIEKNYVIGTKKNKSCFVP